MTDNLCAGLAQLQPGKGGDDICLVCPSCGWTYLLPPLANLSEVLVAEMEHITSEKAGALAPTTRCPVHDTALTYGECPSCLGVPADPHPDCTGRYHGADGGVCDACGFDARPRLPEAGS